MFFLFKMNREASTKEVATAIANILRSNLPGYSWSWNMKDGDDSVAFKSVPPDLSFPGKPDSWDKTYVGGLLFKGRYTESEPGIFELNMTVGFFSKRRGDAFGEIGEVHTAGPFEFIVDQNGRDVEMDLSNIEDLRNAADLVAKSIIGLDDKRCRTTDYIRKRQEEEAKREEVRKRNERGMEQARAIEKTQNGIYSDLDTFAEYILETEEDAKYTNADLVKLLEIRRKSDPNAKKEDIVWYLSANGVNLTNTRTGLTASMKPITPSELSTLVRCAADLNELGFSSISRQILQLITF